MCFGFTSSSLWKGSVNGDMCVAALLTLVDEWPADMAFVASAFTYNSGSYVSCQLTEFGPFMEFCYGHLRPLISTSSCQ